jgi:hypothetical protein
MSIGERAEPTAALWPLSTAVVWQDSEQRATYVVEKSGRSQFVILSLDAYRPLQRAQRTLLWAPAELAAEAFGLWAGRPELDDAWLAEGRQQ